jgi:hypothetical protein
MSEEENSVCDDRSEQLRRRKIEGLIEAIYSETNPTQRKSLIATLAEEEAIPHVRRTAIEFVQRRTIERLIELIYKESDPENRRVLVAILAEEESNGGAATRPSGRGQS